MLDADDLPALAPRIRRVVRARRAARGMSVSELAREAGLSKTIVARIEAGAGNPSMETLWRVSRALQLPLGSLLAEDATPRGRAIPARSGEPLRGDAGLSAWLLHAEGGEHRSEVFDLDLPAGTDQRSEPHLPGTQELVICTSGTLAAGPDGEAVELRPGDAVWFAADVAHGYAAITDARAIDVILYAP